MPSFRRDIADLHFEHRHARNAQIILDRINEGVYGWWNYPLRGPLILNTLAIRSLTLRDVHRGHDCQHDVTSIVDQYLRLQVYQIEYHPKRDDRRQAFAVHTEAGTYEETEAAGGNVQVLRSYWLTRGTADYLCVQIVVCSR